MSDNHSSPAGSGPESALLKQALDLHRSGNLDAARTHYEKVLQINGREINSLTNLATIHFQNGNYREAIRLFGVSVAINSRQPVAFNNLGCAYYELGQFTDAADSYDRSLALKPDYAEAHCNRGNALRGLNRLEEALVCYEQALALAPEYGEAYINRGNVLAILDRHEEAIACFDALIARYPDYATAHYNRASALSDLNRYEEALDGYDQFLRLTSENAAILNKRGNMQRGMGRHLDALASYEKAIGLDGGIPEIHLNRSAVLFALKQRDEALSSCDRALALNPNSGAAHLRRGITLAGLKRYREAVASYEQACRLEVDRAYLPGDLLHVRQQICDWSGLEDSFREILAGIDAGEKSTGPFSVLATPASPRQQRRCAELYVQDRIPPVATSVWTAGPYRHDRIRIGYFSSDFRIHPVAFLIAGLFETHDRKKFEVTGFSHGPPTGDEMHRRIERSFDHFVECEQLADLEILSLARELEIDIAVDLNGFTDGARTRLFVHRVAPVQVNYLGYPGTMGASYFDYLVADAVVIPAEFRSGYSEKIVYLPVSFQPNDPKRVVADRRFTRRELGLPDTGFVFCCFNNNFKIVPFIFDIWMRLLRAVPGSVLWLREVNKEAAQNLRAEAEKRGIAAARLVFAPRMSLLEDHLARQRAADLSLDTCYFNGHTKTSDALWAGLPVITCPGETFASRVAASALVAAGAPELVAPSWQAYEALALELATHPDRLREIRNALAVGRTSCSLFDIGRYTRSLEEAYVRIWQRNQQGLAPEDTRVVDAAPD